MIESSIQTVRGRNVNTFMISGWELSCLFCCWHLVSLISSTTQTMSSVFPCLKLCPIEELWVKELFQVFLWGFFFKCVLFSSLSFFILSETQFQINMNFTSNTLIHRNEEMIWIQRFFFRNGLLLSFSKRLRICGIIGSLNLN